MLFVAGGCGSGNIRDDFVRGWQGQRDVFIHQYVHQSFAQERRWAAQRATLVRSKSLDWPVYARPALVSAVRTEALSQDRGRAVSLERFLAHMRTTPTADATARWFDTEAAAIEEAAEETAAASRALAATLAGSRPVDDDLFQRIETVAAARGEARGRALQHADLRRTARLYFRARDDEVVIPGADGDLSAGTMEPGVAIGARRDPLVDGVNRLLEQSDLRPALLQPRQCDRRNGTVFCTPRPGALLSADESASGTTPGAGSGSAMEDAGEARDAPLRNLFEDRSGW